MKFQNATFQRSLQCRKRFGVILDNPSTQEEAFPEKFKSLRLDARYWVLDIMGGRAAIERNCGGNPRPKRSLGAGHLCVAKSLGAGLAGGVRW